MQSFAAEVLAYVRHVRKHWLSLMAGVVMVALGVVASITSASGWWPWLTFGLAMLFLFVAQFRAYRDIRRDLDGIHMELADQQARLSRIVGHREVVGEAFRVWEAVAVGLLKPIVSNRTFIRCEILGPATIGFLHSAFSGCNLGLTPDAEHLFFEVPSGAIKQGYVLFVNCRFEECQFLNVGFVGSKEALAQLRDAAML